MKSPSSWQRFGVTSRASLGCERSGQSLMPSNTGHFPLFFGGRGSCGTEEKGNVPCENLNILLSSFCLD